MIDTSGDIVSQIRERYHKSAMDKRMFVQSVMLNQQYIKGNQNGYFDANDEYQAEFLMDEGYELKETFNRMLPIQSKRIQILSRNQPDVKVKPVNNHLGIDKKAKITNSLIEKVKLDTEFDKKFKSVVGKIETYDAAFYKIIFDYRIGNLEKLELKRKLEHKKADKKISDNDLSLIVQMIKSGGIDLYVGSSLELYPEKVKSSNLNDNGYLIHAKAYHIEDIKKAYGVKVSSENIDSSSKQEKGKVMSSPRQNRENSTDTQLHKHAMVIEYYEKPTFNRPKGLYCLVAGNKLIDYGDLPYKCGPNNTYGYNFVLMQQIPQEDNLFGESVYKQLRPIQRRYNKNRNIVKQFLENKILGAILAPEGSVEDTNSFTTEIGKIISYNPMFGEPKEWKSGDLPATYWNELAQCETEFSTISGISSSTLTGQLQANVRSGDQMKMLNQNDENSVGITAKSIIDGTVEAFKIILRIIRQKCERLPLEIYENGLDKLTVTPQNILESIYVENAGVVGLTQEQQKASILQLAQLQVLNQENANAYGPEHVRLILDEVGMSHLKSKIDSSAEYQINFINRENNDMVFDKTQKNINDFDDDELHIKYHNRFLMSTEYNDKVLMNSDGSTINENILNHLKQHQDRLQKAQRTNLILASLQK